MYCKCWLKELILNFITPAKPIVVFLGIGIQTSLEPVILSTAGSVGRRADDLRLTESRLSF